MSFFPLGLRLCRHRPTAFHEEMTSFEHLYSVCRAEGPSNLAALERELLRWINQTSKPGIIGLQHELSSSAIEAFINTFPKLEESSWDARLVVPYLHMQAPKRKLPIDLPKFVTIAAFRISSETPGIRTHLATLHRFRTSPPSAEVQPRARHLLSARPSLQPCFQRLRKSPRLRFPFPPIRSPSQNLASRSPPSYGLCSFRFCYPLRPDSTFLSPTLSQRSKRRVAGRALIHLPCSLLTDYIPFPFLLSRSLAFAHLDQHRFAFNIRFPPFNIHWTLQSSARSGQMITLDTFYKVEEALQKHIHVCWLVGGGGERGDETP